MRAAASRLAASALAVLLLGGCAAGATTAKPAAGGGTSSRASGAITMEGNVFTPDTVAVAVGERLTFLNDSPHALHILVIGDKAQARNEKGAPDFGGRRGVRTDPGDTWTSPTWDTPGTFHVTCTVHPRMNLEVRVAQQ